MKANAIAKLDSVYLVRKTHFQVKGKKLIQPLKILLMKTFFYNYEEVECLTAYISSLLSTIQI